MVERKRIEKSLELSTQRLQQQNFTSNSKEYGYYNSNKKKKKREKH